MQRKRVEEYRIWLSYVEKQEVLQKSRGRCAHCGKKLKVGKDMTFTLDHVIPISKGGSNDLSNLVGLCETCNTNKGDDVVDINSYYAYVTPEVGKTLEECFKQYCEEYEFLTHKNVFSKDSFSIKVPYGPLFRKGGKVASKNVTLHKAKYCDLDEIFYFLVNYYKRYRIHELREANPNDTEEQLDAGIKDSVKSLVTIWYSKGGIYFTRGSSGAMNFVVPCRICEYDEDLLDRTLFQYYYGIGPIFITPSIDVNSFYALNYYCVLTRFFMDNLARSLSFPSMIEVLIHVPNSYDERLVKVLEIIFNSSEGKAREQFLHDLDRHFFSIVISNNLAYDMLKSTGKFTSDISPVDMQKVYDESETVRNIIDDSTEYLRKCMASCNDKNCIKN